MQIHIKNRLNESKNSESQKDAADEGLGDFSMVAGRFVKDKGFGWIIAALFVVGEMAGSGIIALPAAMNRATLDVGLCMLCLDAVLATISAILLGKAWVILLRLYPIYRTHCRKPYAEMGYRACGPKTKIFVSICLNITQFMASTAFLLLISQNTSNALLWATNGSSMSFCWLILIVAVCISPLLMCKSPNDFWIGVVLGMVATSVAVVLISIGVFLDAKCAEIAVRPNFSIPNFFLAIGTILFTFGGHSAFPTIQHDMRRPGDFTKSSVLAFIIITAMNVVVVLWGVLTYGDSLHGSIIDSVQTNWIQQAVNILIGLHCLMTLTLLINPLYQEMEEFFKVPQEFCAKRVILRLTILAGMVAVAETVPSFNILLGFVGACLLTLTSLVLPPIFYLFLAANEKRIIKMRNSCKTLAKKFACEDEDLGHLNFSQMLQYTDRKMLVLCITITVMGALLGGVATVTSFADIINMFRSDNGAKQLKPCWWSIFAKNAADSHLPEGITTRCCGELQNFITNSKDCANYKNYYNESIF